MRVVKEIPYQHFKITIFHWNNRYLIKLESGSFEQTFKISELDVFSEDEVLTLLDDTFLEQALHRFDDMAESLSLALGRHP
ncbi:MAG TPA: hypothetical protein PKJ83_14640 [Cyclobacteriaceae bacterium]|nr:hypothetical protein [Cyclobacteriaceae bacterium]HPW62361.1 hypothetical protein [Cyclobacteriaceae bacterium]